MELLDVQEPEPTLVSACLVNALREATSPRGVVEATRVEPKRGPARDGVAAHQPAASEGASRFLWSGLAALGVVTAAIVIVTRGASPWSLFVGTVVIAVSSAAWLRRRGSPESIREARAWEMVVRGKARVPAVPSR